MEIKIGIPTLNREIVVDSDETADAVQDRLTEALSNNSVFRINDAKGRIVLIPSAQIAYVDLGTEQVRPVGFGAV